MAKKLILKTDLCELGGEDTKEVKMTFVALSYKQSKVIKKLYSSVRPPEGLVELQKKNDDEDSDGLTPEEMDRLIELDEEHENLLLPINTEAIRLSLAKANAKEWGIEIPLDSEDVSAAAVYKEKKDQMHDRIESTFSMSEMQMLFQFSTTGTIPEQRAIEHDTGDIDLTK